MAQDCIAKQPPRPHHAARTPPRNADVPVGITARNKKRATRYAMALL